MASCVIERKGKKKGKKKPEKKGCFLFKSSGKVIGKKNKSHLTLYKQQQDTRTELLTS